MSNKNVVQLYADGIPNVNLLRYNYQKKRGDVIWKLKTIISIRNRTRI